MTAAEYAKYLRTSHWQRMREVALRRADHRCQVCNTTKQLHVHHRTYERCPGHERAADLTVLCSGCHDLYHRKLRPPGGVTTAPRKPKLSKNQRRKQRQRDAMGAGAGALADSLDQMKKRNRGKPLRMADYSKFLDDALDTAVERDA